MKKQQTKKNAKQAAKFGFVGVLNTLVDTGMFYLLITVGIHKGVSQLVATAIAMCVSFLLNRCWTFERQGRGSVSEIAKFIVVNLVSMGVVIAVTHVFYDFWHLERIANAVFGLVSEFTLEGNNAVLFCKLGASAFSIVLNFLGNKFWVFRSKNNKETGAKA